MTTARSAAGFDGATCVYENEISNRFSLGLQQTVFNFQQSHFRFRTDSDVVDATPTWGAGEDVL